MKLTVKDCLQLNTFATSVIVAGEGGLETRVRAVTVMDAEAGIPDKDFTVGTMVLTSFAGMKGNIALQKAAISALAKQGASCLVVWQKEKEKSAVSSEVVQAANVAGLPLLILPAANIGYADVISEVMEKLLSGSSFRNSLINNTIFQLLDFEKHGNFIDALHDAATSNDFQVILLNEEYSPIFTIETRHQTTVTEAIRRGKNAALNLSNVYTRLEIDGVLTYWGVVNIEGQKHYLIIVDNEDNYSSDDITKLAEIIELAMGMWRYTPQRDAKLELVNALIRGNTRLAISLLEEAGIKENKIVGVFYAQGIETTTGDHIIEEYEKKDVLKVYKIAEDGHTYAVVVAGANAKKCEGEEKGACNKLFDELKVRDAANGEVRIFHVTGVDGIDGAAGGFNLIGQTWASVEKIFPYKRVFSKYELVLVSNCINLQINGGQLKQSYTDLLKEFRNEKDHKAIQLLDTLETFVLDAGMNSSKTAEFMQIHTNTVQYRLKKISEMLGAEITGNRVIPGLTIALALSRIERE